MNYLLEAIKHIEFDNVDELYLNIDLIKQRYKELPKEIKKVYKWYYFYQLSVLKDTEKFTLKETIWNYLNDLAPIGEVNYLYRIFCNKKKKTQHKSQMSLF